MPSFPLPAGIAAADQRKAAATESLRKADCFFVVTGKKIWDEDKTAYVIDGSTFIVCPGEDLFGFFAAVRAEWQRNAEQVAKEMGSGE